MSEQEEHLVAEIEQLAVDYKPDQGVLQKLSEITLVAVIGPSAVGKTTVMSAAARLDSDFARVTSFTTRQPRKGEPTDTYKFLGHSVETLRNILRQIERRELVQIAVHPTTKKIYGSVASDYPKPFMMLDALPDAIEGLEALSFKAMKQIAMSATPSLWAERFQARYAADSTGFHESIRNRLEEGIANISWSLEQDDEIQWLDNSSPNVDAAAQRLIAIAKHDTEPDTAARLTGGALLDLLELMHASTA